MTTVQFVWQVAGDDGVSVDTLIVPGAVTAEARRDVGDGYASGSSSEMPVARSISAIGASGPTTTSPFQSKSGSSSAHALAVTSLSGSAITAPLRLPIATRTLQSCRASRELPATISSGSWSARLCHQARKVD